MEEWRESIDGLLIVTTPNLLSKIGKYLYLCAFYRDVIQTDVCDDSALQVCMSSDICL